MHSRIGGEYRLESISRRHWRRFAESNRLDPDATLTRIREIADHVADALSTVVSSEPVRALGSDLPGRLLDRVAARADRCRAALDR